jgi:CDP-glucose 4,6-dehydratase
MAPLVSPPFGRSFAGRRVLVTGAYGMLGASLSRALIDLGSSVVVLRRGERPRSALTLDGTEARCTVVHGDLLDADLLERTVVEHAVDSVVHLAAQTIVPTAIKSPRSTFETNVRGTWNVLEACRIHAVERTIVASSDKAYGDSDILPLTEDLPLRAAAHPYDASKAAADLIARSYAHTYGLPVVVTRLANIYGPGDQNPSRLIPESVAAVLEGRAPVVRSDGSPERDFLYVTDAVSAYLAISDLLDLGRDSPAWGAALNAGGGTPHRAIDVVRSVCAAGGRPDLEPDVRGTGRLNGEIDRQWVDSSLLRALTGWEPQVTLEEGLQRTIAWYRKYRAGVGAP